MKCKHANLKHTQIETHEIGYYDCIDCNALVACSHPEAAREKSQNGEYWCYGCNTSGLAKPSFESNYAI